MPVFKVTAPDGQVISVEAAPDASDNDLISLAQAKIAARPGPMTTEERFLTSTGGRYLKGVKDGIDAGAQLLPRGLSMVVSAGGLLPNKASKWLDDEAAKVDADIKNSEQDYQNARFKAGQSGMDGWRAIGSIVNPATLALSRISPAGATTAVGRSLQGAVGGAVGGALATPVKDTSETSFGMAKAGQAVSGAVGGALFSPVVGKVVDAGAPVVKRVQAAMTRPDVLAAQVNKQTDQAVTAVLRDAGVEGTLPPPALAELRRQVQESFRKGQKIDAAAALRKLDFEALGIPALRGQITRDPSQYSRDLNLRGIEGVGEPIQKILTAQNQGITAGLSRFGGPQADDAYQAGEKFNTALKSLDERLSGEVGRAYRNARASSGKDWDIPLQGIAHEVQGIVDDFGVGGEKNAVPTAIYNRLKGFGIVGDGMTQRKVFNYEEADKLLKQINAHDDGMNGSLGPLRQAVKQALVTGGGDGDPFALPRKMAAARFSLLDAIPALEAAAKTKNPQELSRLSDNFVQKHIVSAKVADLRKLADVLPDEARQEAKRQIARVIYDGAFKGNATGDKMASPAGLQQAIKQIGVERLKVFFSPQEIQELQRLTRVTAYANTEPAWGTVARGGNPGGVLLGGLARLGSMGSKTAAALPLISVGQNALRASSATNTAIPKAANLSPEEIAKLARFVNIGSVGMGGLLAPE